MPDPAPAIDTRATEQPPVFVPGDVVSAGKLNRVVELALGNATGINPPRLLRSGAVTDFRIYAMRVVSEDGDFVLCVPEGDYGSNLPSFGSVRVAKPYLLRRTPFHGKTRDGITYYYYEDDGVTLSANTRDAYDTDNHVEEQVIVPGYVAGDTIYASRAVAGGIAVTPAGQPQTVTDFLDLNTDGRAWGAS